METTVKFFMQTKTPFKWILSIFKIFVWNYWDMQFNEFWPSITP